MALGQMVGEARGKITASRVLPDGKMEISQQGNGKLLESEIVELITNKIFIRPNGTAYGEAHGIIMSTNGSALWKGSATGKPVGLNSWKYDYGGAFQTVVPRAYLRLLDVYIIGESDVDENGNYHWKQWEWKH